MNNLKTDNSFLREKIILRLLNLPEKDEIKVLDCYHGNGTIWKNIKLNTDKKIIVHGIDKEKRDDFALVGDNMKIFDSLDLLKYDIIDLDAYGIPDEQIKSVVDKIKTGCVVFFTFIQSVMGRLSNRMMRDIGISEIMFNKCPSIFSKLGKNYFFSFLACLNIKTVVYLKIGRKIYGYFIKS